MNILLLSYFFSVGLEGTAIVFINIAELLAKNGHKVWVVTNKFEGVKYPKHENLKIVFISSPQKYQKKQRTTIYDTIRYILSTVKTGASIVKNEKIDIIHSNGGFAGLAGSILSMITSKDHILTIHNVYPKDFWKEWAKQPGNSKFKAFLGKIQQNIVIKSRYTVIHTVSELVKENLEKLGVKKPIIVIPNAIKFSEPCKVTTNPHQFVLISRLVFYKNAQVVIKALKIVKKNFPQISLVIIGDGPYRKTLEELANKMELEDNVTFKGTIVDEAEKNKIIAGSLALVFPSYYESFGLVILEAFAQRKPVLASNKRPLSEIVENQKTGLLISPYDKDEWAKTLEFVLKEPIEAKKMGENGHNILKEKYTLEQMNNKIIDMYYNVVNGFN